MPAWLSTRKCTEKREKVEAVIRKTHEKNISGRTLRQLDDQGLYPKYSFPAFFFFVPQWGVRTQKLKPHLVKTQSLNGLPLEPGVAQYIAIHATLTARDFFLANFYPSGTFTCIFSQNLSRFFLCWLWLTHGSRVGPQNKIGHPAGGMFPCWGPRENKLAQKTWLVIWWPVKWLTWR